MSYIGSIELERGKMNISKMSGDDDHTDNLFICGRNNAVTANQSSFLQVRGVPWIPYARQEGRALHLSPCLGFG